MEILPSPMDTEAIVGINPDTDKEEKRKPSVDEPFAALAFKIATDPFVGRLCFTRAYSGRLESGSYVLNTRTGQERTYFPNFSNARKQAESDPDSLNAEILGH